MDKPADYCDQPPPTRVRAGAALISSRQHAVALREPIQLGDLRLETPGLAEPGRRRRGDRGDRARRRVRGGEDLRQLGAGAAQPAIDAGIADPCGRCRPAIARPTSSDRLAVAQIAHGALRSRAVPARGRRAPDDPTRVRRRGGAAPRSAAAKSRAAVTSCALPEVQVGEDGSEGRARVSPEWPRRAASPRRRPARSSSSPRTIAELRPAALCQRVVVRLQARARRRQGSRSLAQSELKTCRASSARPVFPGGRHPAPWPSSATASARIRSRRSGSSVLDAEVAADAEQLGGARAGHAVRFAQRALERSLGALGLLQRPLDRADVVVEERPREAGDRSMGGRRFDDVQAEPATALPPTTSPGPRPVAPTPPRRATDRRPETPACTPRSAGRSRRPGRPSPSSRGRRAAAPPRSAAGRRGRARR